MGVFGRGRVGCRVLLVYVSLGDWSGLRVGLGIRVRPMNSQYFMMNHRGVWQRWAVFLILASANPQANRSPDLVHDLVEPDTRRNHGRTIGEGERHIGHLVGVCAGSRAHRACRSTPFWFRRRRRLSLQDLLTSSDGRHTILGSWTIGIGADLKVAARRRQRTKFGRVRSDRVSDEIRNLVDRSSVDSSMISTVANANTGSVGRTAAKQGPRSV